MPLVVAIEITCSRGFAQLAVWVSLGGTCNFLLHHWFEVVPPPPKFDTFPVSSEVVHSHDTTYPDESPTRLPLSKVRSRFPCNISSAHHTCGICHGTLENTGPTFGTHLRGHLASEGIFLIFCGFVEVKSHPRWVQLLHWKHIDQRSHGRR